MKCVVVSLFVLMNDGSLTKIILFCFRGFVRDSLCVCKLTERRTAKGKRERWRQINTGKRKRNEERH